MKKRYHELTRREYQTIEKTTGIRKAKRGMKNEARDAKELFELLRTATYTQIGILNALHRVARDFSAVDGSNWRNNRGAAGRVHAVALKLYKTDVTDSHALIELENELEAIYLDATNEGKKK